MSPLPADRLANLVIWAVVWLVLLGWAMVTAIAQLLPSFADLLALLRRSWVTRWGLIVIWAWLGWHLFVRTTG